MLISRRAAGLGEDADYVRERALCGTNRIIADQHDAIDAVPHDGEPQLSDPPRRERLGRNAAGLGVERATGRERPIGKKTSRFAAPPDAPHDGEHGK